MTWAWGAIKGVFYRPRAVLREWRAHDPEPVALLTRFTIPVIVLSVVASAMAHDVLPSGFPPETRPQLVPFSIYSGLTQLVGVLALAAAAHYLCDLFQGRSDFRRALAAVSVAMVPAWVGNVLAALPWPYGASLALGGILYSLVLLYAAFVVILGMRPGNRVGHYAASLGAALLVVFAFGWQAVSLIPGAAPEVRLGTTWLI
ncbi:Yip1 family protein [Aquisalimonas asiatica]|uniref:Yip1 domain-containing protein n=1 Tax=Aquisalimonas asiatica TaxID=406100 RepID=A0A1H8RSE2_9GAMM|nr:Yip1 family protein [Aquisalimonas asiatica]SEO69539.1 Yip1 domain-containing protein [Aquisalimonas asiatica]